MSVLAFSTPVSHEVCDQGQANARAARVIATALAAAAPLHVVLSPGARSTPLAVAFAELPGARTVVVLDERAAGFVALGMARASGRPAVLVCTSGSAPGHYLPAIMEADRGRVPLIVMSADRPPELHHCGAAQTIDQRSMFGSYVRWSADLPVPEPHPAADGCAAEGWLVAMATRAHAAAAGSPPGPVHLNAPFRKPLFARDDAATPMPPPVRLVSGAAELDSLAIAALADELTSEPRGVILCGPTASATTDCRALGNAVAALASRLGWPVVADAASGVCIPGAIRFADALARSNALPRAQMVLHIGAPPTSQSIADWVTGCPRTLLVDPDGWYLDPTARADTLIAADPTRLCLALADGPHRVSDTWLRRWNELERRAEHAVVDAIAEEGAGFGGAVARALARAMPSGGRLHVASSMPIRDVDSFAGALQVTASANRGVNGIDGTIATALGVALASGATTVALSGDLALVHDVSGLLAACSSGAALSIVVCNNDGGAIFEALPIAEDIDRAAFERLFATPQGHDLGAICRAAGARHRLADAATLGAALADDVGRPGVGVIEVVLDREREAALRTQVWRRVCRTLQQHMEEP